MYAWSKFATEIDETTGAVGKWINPGDEVSQADLGVSDEEWQELQDSGAVSETPYPDVAVGQSPAEYYQQNPDEAPEVDVNEETPQPEAMAKQDVGMALGEKPPGATEAAAAADEQAKAADSSSTSGGGGASS
jgi:hypothetical protein